MRSVALALTCLAILLSCPAYAKKDNSIRPYLSVNAGRGGIGIVNIENSSDTDGPATVDSDNASDSVYVLGAAFGIQFRTFNRIEFEFMYRDGMDYNPGPGFNSAASDTELESDVSNMTFMINYVREFGQFDWMVRPFLMAGLGLSQNTTDSTLRNTSTGERDSDNETSNDFAWLVGGGAAFHFTKHVGMDIGLRYVDLGEVKWGEDAFELTGDMGVVEGIAAVRYMF